VDVLDFILCFVLVGLLAEVLGANAYIVSQNSVGIMRLKIKLCLVGVKKVRSEMNRNELQFNRSCIPVRSVHPSLRIIIAHIASVGRSVGEK